MKALNCKGLSAELAMHTVNGSTYALFTSDDHYLLLTLVGKGHQTNLPHGNFNELQMADLAVQNEKQVITQERSVLAKSVT